MVSNFSNMNNNDDNKSVMTTRSRIHEDTKLRDDLIKKFFDKMKDKAVDFVSILGQVIEKAIEEKTPFDQNQINNLNIHTTLENKDLQILISQYKYYKDWSSVKDGFFELANTQINDDTCSVMQSPTGMRSRQYLSFRRT